MPRAPVERDGGGEDRHREQEVGHDEARLELEDHREPAEDRLREHAERQQRGQHRQVAPARLTPEREDERRDARQPDDAGDEPVAELDPRVELERRRDPVAALRPVRASEPRAGEPHGRAREHDREQQDERDQRDALVLAGRERREPVHRGRV
jgi:hypothetical protein